jgi:hypothetical protein
VTVSDARPEVYRAALYERDGRATDPAMFAAAHDPTDARSR